MKIQFISLTLLTGLTLLGCARDNRQADSMEGAVTGAWSIYAADQSRVGEMSFLPNDSIYFTDACCPLSGIYREITPAKYGICFTPRACPAHCLTHFPDAEITARIDGNTLLLYTNGEEARLKGQRQAMQ